MVEKRDAVPTKVSFSLLSNKIHRDETPSVPADVLRWRVAFLNSRHVNKKDRIAIDSVCRIPARFNAPDLQSS
jgi:hypothetical protein